MQTKEWMPVWYGVPDHEKKVRTWGSLDGYVIGSLHDVDNGTEEWRDELGDEYEPSHWQPVPEEPLGDSLPVESLIVSKAKLLTWVNALSTANYKPAVKVYNELRTLLRMHGTGRPPK